MSSLLNSEENESTSSGLCSTTSWKDAHSNPSDMDFSQLSFKIQKRFLILDLNVIEAKWTRSIYNIQRTRLVKESFSNVSLTGKIDEKDFRADLENPNSNGSEMTNLLSTAVPDSPIRMPECSSTVKRESDSTIPDSNLKEQKEEAETIKNARYTVDPSLFKPLQSSLRLSPPILSLHHEGPSRAEFTSSLNQLDHNSFEFLSPDSLDFPSDYLWQQLCKHVGSKSNSSLKVLNDEGSISKQVSYHTFLRNAQSIAQFLQLQAKRNSSSSSFSDTTSFTFEKFIVFSNDFLVFLECILAGWLGGIPCAPFYLDSGKSKFEFLTILELIQPQFIILDPADSSLSFSSVRKWLPKQYPLHRYEDLLRFVPSCNSSPSLPYRYHPIMYIDTHWHPTSVHQQQLRTTAVSSATVHQHCFWLSKYMESNFLQPYKLNGLSFLVCLACLSHGSSLLLIGDIVHQFSMEQWIKLLQRHHIQSTWLRSTTMQYWHPFSSPSLKQSLKSPSKFILLEDPNQSIINHLSPYGENLIGYTCCDTLAGLLVGLGEPQISMTTTTLNPILSKIEEFMYLPSLIKLPQGGPHLYISKSQKMRGYYLMLEKFKDQLTVLNLGNSDDLWYPLDEQLRYPLFYRSWLLKAFPQIKCFFLFFFCKLPWLLYTGEEDPNQLSQFLKQENQVNSFALVKIECIDSLNSHWHHSFVRQFFWKFAKGPLILDNPVSSVTQPFVTKSLQVLDSYPCIFEYLIYNAEHIPNQVAYIDSEQQLTWKQLNQKISLSAMYMLKKGLSPGDHIIVSYIHSIDYLVTLHACLYSGILPIPMPPPDLARLTEEVPRWVSVILEFHVQAILCGDGVFELLYAKPFRHPIKKYSKFCSFPVIHHLTLSQLPTHQISSTQTLGKDGLQLPSQFLVNPAVPALIHVTFDKEYPKPVCSYTHSQLVFLTEIMSQTLSPLHPKLEKPTVVSCVRTYAGFGLIHALGLGPLLGLPTLLLSTMVFSSDPETWLKRMQHQPLFITKPMIQFARHLGLNLIDRLERPILLHEHAIPISLNPIPCFWEISGAPLASCGPSKILYLDAKVLCHHGLIHYHLSPQPYTIPITSAGSVVYGGQIEVRPWNHHAPLGNGFGKFMFRYPSSSPFQGSLDTYHYGFLADDHVYPICESIVPQGNGVVPVELMEAIMEQHVGLTIFVHSKNQDSTIHWTVIIELILSMYYSHDTHSSLSSHPPSLNDPKKILTHGLMAIVQGYFDIKNYFGIHVDRVLVVHPGSLPKTRLNEKQRSLALEQYHNKKLKIVKELILG